jgi:hypothetical protein
LISFSASFSAAVVSGFMVLSETGSTDVSVKLLSSLLRFNCGRPPSRWQMSHAAEYSLIKFS